MFALDRARIGHLGQQFLRPDMLALGALCAACLPLLRRQDVFRLAGVAVAVAAASLLVAASGRSGVNYVFQPMLALLAVLALAALPPHGRAWRVPAAAGVVALPLVLFQQVPIALAHQRSVAAARDFLAALDSDRVQVAWGAALPFESLYPPLARREQMPSLRIFGVGTHQLSPMAAAQFGGDPSAVVRLLRSEEGIALISSPWRMTFLETYCRERFDGRIRQEPRAALGEVRAAIVRCEARSGSP